MKTIGKFTHKGKECLVKKQITESYTNYNVFGMVFLKGDKTPLVGKTFRNDASNEKITEWAKGAVNYKEGQVFFE